MTIRTAWSEFARSGGGVGILVGIMQRVPPNRFSASSVTNLELEAWLGINYESMPDMQLAILDAAAKVFTTFGFAAASVDVIAKEVGATKGSVYYHYRSKADLFFAVHKRAMTMNLQAQVPIVRDGALNAHQKLHDMAYQHAMLMMDHLYYQRVTVQGVELHQSASTTPGERLALAEVVAMRDAYESLFRGVLRAGVDDRIFEALDCDLAVKGILGALNWITVWYRPRDTDTKLYKEKVAQQFARQAIFGVAPGQ